MDVQRDEACPEACAIVLQRQAGDLVTSFSYLIDSGMISRPT